MRAFKVMGSGPGYRIHVAQSILIPRSKPSFPGLHLVETAHAVGIWTIYQEDPYREARLAVAISSLEVPSICDSADRSPT